MTSKWACKVLCAVLSLGGVAFLASCSRVEQLGCAGPDAVDQIPDLVKAPLLQLMSTRIEDPTLQNSMRSAIDQLVIRMEDIRTIEKGPGQDRSCKGVLRMTVPAHVIADANEYARLAFKETVDGHLRRHGFSRAQSVISWPTEYTIGTTPSGTKAKAALSVKLTTDILFTMLEWQVDLPAIRQGSNADTPAAPAAFR